MKPVDESEDNMPAVAKRRFKDALRHVVQLYDATGKPEEAAKWKRELAARDLKICPASACTAAAGRSA